MNNSKILIIDDDVEVHNQIRLCLNNYDLFFSETISQAGKILNQENIDLVILDISLPDGNGFSYFMEIQKQKKYSNLPIIFLSSKDKSIDKVTGLSLGADDYIVKPFDRLEFSARVFLRLSNSKKKIQNIISKKDLEIEVLNQRLYLRIENEKKQINLTAFEFKLLLYLIDHENQVLTRNQLIESVWDDNVNVVDRVVDAHISNLRKKIKCSSYSIRSVYGEGYQFFEAKHKIKKVAA